MTRHIKLHNLLSAAYRAFTSSAETQDIFSPFKLEIERREQDKDRAFNDNLISVCISRNQEYIRVNI